MPQDAVLTTECNAEPYIRWLDGYLTWNWQFDGQVPAFPAVYGGVIQMFGRAYRGGATKDLALRMKAGQQLVFGEQLGWLDPSFVTEHDTAAFFRQAAHLRARLNRYFSAGQMARPPRLEGGLPKVRADWQWSGPWWVTTEAVLSGAWEIPEQRRLALLFANVSDQPVQAELKFEPAAYTLPAGKFRAQTIMADAAAGKPERLEAPFNRTITFPARQVEALELRW